MIRVSIAQVTFLVAVLFSGALLSCAPRHEHIKPQLSFQTGPATFMQLGGVISTFSIIFDQLGSEPMEEFGVVYTFDEDVKDNYPDLNDQKVAFELPAKQNANEKVVNIGFPAGAHALGYRAYVKLKDGRVEYAPPIITAF